HGRPLGAPTAGEDARATHDAVGVDAVDADTVRAQFGCKQAYLVGLVGLGGGVGDVVRSGEHGVLRGDVDAVSAHVLGDHRPGGLARDQEGAAGHHVVLGVPVGGGGLQQRLGQRQAGVVHHQVHPAEGQCGGVDQGGDLVFVGDRKSTRLNSSHVSISYA